MLSGRYRTVEIFRAAWGAALLIAPERVLNATHSAPVDAASRVVTRVLGARHLVQAALSGLRPDPDVLAMGVWVDAVHALTASLLAASDPRRARAGYTDAVIAGGWAVAGCHDLRRGRVAPREHQRVRDGLAALVLRHVPGGRLIRGQQRA
ncbi:hypothetical protein [Mycolicibacterium chubuense]|uniref:Uncharacterized protein n=1 Tax=Mycolicibacterium chubuense TaxID=1800 RepID=A0A0J6YKB0_MYCCU|nr:hypothetical protein [Mycolicibacterium chubuense]KMO73256.1 hypothetical protein MCHUDSM44219_04434 [Mycolicibacterium chubuense]SPX98792.1 Uncharacterised protein [Mycolicibacterium chubuense]